MLHKTTTEFREKWIALIHQLQNDICESLELCDGKSLFSKEEWLREEGKGGGGITRVIQDGNVFEKGGVNTSVVHGTVDENMKKYLSINGDKWFASGISIVIHPINPFVPTVHCNYRMFELYDKEDKLIDRWFGGGTDLTPYYLIEEDAVHFHSVFKNICDVFDPSFYPEFKKNCDDYFVNTHRGNERRGIGGIFYDHKRPDKKHDEEFWLSLAGALGGTGFLQTYLLIVNLRKGMPFNEEQKRWQEIRRGRYVEFNLLHDRGTLFGLKTNGRTESILMSLPKTCRFEYDHHPLSGSEEDKLLEVCLHPKEWAE